MMANTHVTETRQSFDSELTEKPTIELVTSNYKERGCYPTCGPCGPCDPTCYPSCPPCTPDCGP